MSVSEVAKDLGLSDRTIQRYCKSDALPARQIWLDNHYTYQIEEAAYYEWKQEHFKGLRRGEIAWDRRKTKELSKAEILKHIDIWIEWCITGKLNGKPIAPRTAHIYHLYITKYLDLLGPRPSTPIISINNVRETIGRVPIAHYSTRRNIYDAIRSFSKYLVEIEQMDVTFLEKLKRLRPRPSFPAKRTFLTEDELNKFIQTIDFIPCYPPYDKLVSKTIIIFLANTGLRNSEMCNLKLEHVDFEKQRIYVHLGKGNKNRSVGMTNKLKDTLIEYLEARSRFNSEYFFVGRYGQPFDNQVIARKIHRLAESAGVKITPHGLRRTFITVNANKGCPLNHLRIAAGHSDLSTTQGYLMTSEDEVVEAMKGW